jgi:hypothetical protein
MSLCDEAVHAHIDPYKDVNYQELMDDGVCMYSITIYPTAELIASFKSMKPALYTGIIGCIFFVMALTFFIFNRYIQRRNKKVVLAAAKSNAIVSTIFPSTVRDRLFQSTDSHVAATTGLKAFLKSGQQSGDDSERDGLLYQTKPIADLFPEVCIIVCHFEMLAVSSR